MSSSPSARHPQHFYNVLSRLPVGYNCISFFRSLRRSYCHVYIFFCENFVKLSFYLLTFICRSHSMGNCKTEICQNRNFFRETCESTCPSREYDSFFHLQKQKQGIFCTSFVQCFLQCFLKAPTEPLPNPVVFSPAAAGQLPRRRIAAVPTQPHRHRAPAPAAAGAGTVSRQAFP